MWIDFLRELKRKKIIRRVTFFSNSFFTQFLFGGGGGGEGIKHQLYKQANKHTPL